MRASRVLILVAFTFTSVTLLLLSRRNARASDSLGIRSQPSHTLRGILSFSAPLSLLAPNAIISLTDDNTTSFVAKPAAYGPGIPEHGLSGQLWSGSGFGGKDDIVIGGDGELGCSDVLGWNGVSQKSRKVNKLLQVPAKMQPARRKKMDKRGGETEADLDRAEAIKLSSFHQIDDGTDDYLHPTIHQKPGDVLDPSTAAAHADIQSIQEGAEIAGKVVLLSRGGCGFLEKTKWVQRRGGIALIVGDDTRGGPLIQMYARGDTSNVTIPSIFTSYTTAQLLSSLIPSGSYIEDTLDDFGRPTAKVRQAKTFKKAKPLFAKTPTAKKLPVLSAQSSTVHKKQGWSLWSSKRPVESKEWIMVTDFDKDQDVVKAKPKAETIKNSVKTKSGPADIDGFVIGVQDWRDPDLLDRPSRNLLDVQTTPTTGKHLGVAKVGTTQEATTTRGGLLYRLFGADEDESNAPLKATDSHDDHKTSTDKDEHQGLWVTITPTSAGSPFLDTLLVLVVSPLITLTVVYAMLLLRTRIRRRRWRAPKSVVESLPVRTYHTIATSASAIRLASPTSATPTTPLLQSRARPRSRTTSGLPEPGVLSRSPSILTEVRTTAAHAHREKNGVSSEWKKYMGKQVECVVCLEEYVDGVSRVMSLPCGHEFHVDCITPWLTTRRRTCPICKGDVVRSLKKARTSNRSPHSPSPSGRASPTYSPFRDDSDDSHDDDDENLQAQIAGTVNQAPGSQLPITTHSNGSQEDLETGIATPAPRRPSRWGFRRTASGGDVGGWRGLFTGRPAGLRTSRSQDRNR